MTSGTCGLLDAVAGRSETQYAKTADGGHVAYQTTGDGPVDVIFMATWAFHIEIDREIPQLDAFIERTSSFCRLIRIDVRGSGLADPLPAGTPLSLEGCAQDIRTVVEAIGCGKVALFANGPAGLQAITFAALYPELTSALVLDGCYARLEWAEDHPIGIPRELLQTAAAEVETTRGPTDLRYLAPSTRDNPELVKAWGRLARSAMSTALAVKAADLIVSSDVRHLLSSIRAPTLILYRDRDRFAGEPHARHLAEHIAGSTVVPLPGTDNLVLFGDTTAVLEEVQDFLTGDRGLPEFDRLLTTIMFTDIVASTERAASSGDRRWRELLEQHDGLVNRELDRFRGRKIKTTGDGVLATFDSPTRAARCAARVLRSAELLGLSVRVGLHTGEIEDRGDDIAGINVHVAQRICAAAAANETLASDLTGQLITASDVSLEVTGDYSLKGLAGTWRLSRVVVH